MNKPDSTSNVGPARPGAIGYLVPEFPGQTHIWIWREITHMREWGVPLRLYSTRRPPERDRARHAFAPEAERQTQYVWPRGVGATLGAVAWAAITRPVGFLRCVRVGLTLPVSKGPAWRSVLPLIVPACVLARLAVRDGVRHLHSHSCAGSAILAMMVRELTGIPYSLTLNANIEWWGGAMREKFGAAAFVISITEWLLDQIRRDFPELPQGRAILGRIGVDTRRWPERNGAARAPGPWRVVTVGRLHESKGHDILLRAIAELLRRQADVTLRLVGAGPDREALERLAADLGLADRVSFAGSLSEDGVIQELLGADVFALASHAEPLGVVYMEAMATGTPTVGTRAGGVPEIITDGVDGLLVPPRDPAWLADAIARLLANDELRRAVGHRGRVTVERRFDSRIGAATLYERLMGAAPPGMSA